MERELTHEDSFELLGAYALDAIDSDERVEIEEHLHECPRCRAELAGFRETAALLAHTGEDAPGPIWDRIISEIGSTEAPPLDIDRIAPVASIDTARDSRGTKSVSMRVLGSILGAAAVIAALLSITVLRQENRIDSLQTALAKDGSQRAALLAASDPDSQRMTLASSDKATKASAVMRKDGTVSVVSDNMKPLPADKTYQVWAIINQQPISAGLLGSDPTGRSFRVPANTEGIAITEEVSSGVVASVHDPVVAAELKA